MIHPALEAIRIACQGTEFEGDVFLVGGAVRDYLLHGELSSDLDLVTRGNATKLATMLRQKRVSSIFPVTYERFGTAMVQVEGMQIELVTARKEAYDGRTRKPVVQPGTYLDDAMRRDFTVNTLMMSLDSNEVVDPLGNGLADMEAKCLRTPLDPKMTFADDPLRMLRAVRFRWKLGFEPAAGLYEAIHESRDRLKIISFERIRDELLKMLRLPDGWLALDDLMKLGLFEYIAPEFLPMVGCEQGNYHNSDVWGHTLKVVENAGHRDEVLALAALFHDVAKPETKSLDEEGRIRFFNHEVIGEGMTQEILKRWKLPQAQIQSVSKLVRHHMRLGTSPKLSPSAARRLVRDLGPELDLLLDLVDADSSALKNGVKVLNMDQIRSTVADIKIVTPVEKLESPLTGDEIQELLGIGPGPQVGEYKRKLLDAVLDGELDTENREAAKVLLLKLSAS